MSVASPQLNTTVSLAEIEALIRRAVKEAVREEFARVLRHAPAEIAADWAQEGPDDPEADQLVLAEALAARERYRVNAEGWMDWDAFKAELKAAEEAGELPD